MVSHLIPKGIDTPPCYPTLPWTPCFSKSGKTTNMYLKLRHDGYELCDLSHVNVSEPQSYICKVTVMVLPEVVVELKE